MRPTISMVICVNHPHSNQVNWSYCTKEYIRTAPADRGGVWDSVTAVFTQCWVNN